MTKRTLLLLVLALAGMVGAGVTFAQSRRDRERNSQRESAETRAPRENARREPANDTRERGPRTGEGFQEYSVILQRNIFDPQRRPVPPPGSRAEPTPPPPPVETVSLLGTWLSDQRTNALLESGTSRYDGSRNVGFEMAGWRIDAITLDAVTLVKGDQRIEWPVGEKIERVGDGEWHLAGRATPGASTSSGGNSNSSPGNPFTANKPAATGGSGGSADDILERMRQRRAQETK